MSKTSRGKGRDVKKQTVVHPPRLVEMSPEQYQEAVELLATLVFSYVDRLPPQRLGRKESSEVDHPSPEALPPSTDNEARPSEGPPDLLGDAIQAWRTRVDKQPSRDEQLASLSANIRKKEQIIQRYMRAFETGSMPEDVCGPRVRSLQEAIESLRAQRERLVAAEAMAPGVDPLPEMDLGAFLSVVMEEKEDLPVLKAFLRVLIEEIRVDGHELHPTFRVPQGQTEGVETE